MAPPYLSGPFFSLQLRKSVLSGFISGDTAPGGAVHVAIERDGASGYGPHGPVAMDFFEEDVDLVADGLWNGQRVHLAFGSAGLRGTVADNTGSPRTRTALPEMRDVRQRRSSLTNPRRLDDESALEPGSRDSSCQYVLDESPGPSKASFSGISICAGMPQPTRLEVPAAALTLLSRAELVTLLVAVLSAPPLTLAEGAALTNERPELGFEPGPL